MSANWYKCLKFLEAKSTWTKSQAYCTNDGTYDVDQLIKITDGRADKKVELSELEHFLSENVWGFDEKLTPTMVLKDKNKYKEYYEDILKANLGKPILIRESNGEIIDGYHRLTRAFIEKRDYIKAIYVSDEEMKEAKIEDLI